MKKISPAEAGVLIENKVVKDLTDLEANGYTVDFTAGASNTAAPTPEVTPVNEEMVEAATFLFLSGRTTVTGKDGKTKALKTQRGRPKSILGAKDGVGHFAISISVDPDFVPSKK